MSEYKDKICKTCSYVEKDYYCGASRHRDLVTGNEHRSCSYERLDGHGRCGSLGNNYREAKPVKRKAKKQAVTA